MAAAVQDIGKRALRVDGITVAVNVLDVLVAVCEPREGRRAAGRDGKGDIHIAGVLGKSTQSVARSEARLRPLKAFAHAAPRACAGVIAVAIDDVIAGCALNRVRTAAAVDLIIGRAAVDFVMTAKGVYNIVVGRSTR